MFAHRHRYLFIVCLSLITYICTLLCKVYFYFDIQIEWYYAFGTILIITFLTWEGSRWLHKFFDKPLSSSPNKIKWLLYFFAVSSFITTFFTTGLVLLVSLVMHQHSLSQAFVPLKLNLIYAGLVNLLFHLLNAITFYFKQYELKLVEADELRRVTAQAELQLIKSQVNPHFLFNNLNVLSALVLKNNLEANKFIEAFSKVYRYILNTHDKELVDLATELDYIKPYIFLLEKRFSEGLSINIDIPSRYEKNYIIPASLQMLIENAIKHNVVSKQKPLHIEVRVNGNNSIIVTNNLQCRESVEFSTRIGLQNIKKRYLLVGGREVLVQKNESEFKVSLPMLILN